MLTPDQREKIVAIIDAADDLTIATNRVDGYPQATVVSFVSDGMSVYFGTWAKSHKAQNIGRDPRVSSSGGDGHGIAGGPELARRRLQIRKSAPPQSRRSAPNASG